MDINLHEVAVRPTGDEPAARPGIRLLLDVRPSGDRPGFTLNRLHDESVGTLARVVSGVINLGTVDRVAVKLQRDEPLPQGANVSRAAADAKFLEEFRIHCKLAEAADPDRSAAARTTGNAEQARPIVRFHDLRPGNGHIDVQRLPPCLFCVKATHAMAWKGSVEQTLRKSDACGACDVPQPLRPGRCGAYLVDPINRAHNAILIFELMEAGSLWDFLVERGVERRREFRPPGPDQTAAALTASLDIIEDILAGVVFLHERGTAHLDLNPVSMTA